MSDINFKDNITLGYMESNIKFSCQGCIYQTSSTAVNLSQPNSCNICARNYKDCYTSTAVPLKNDNK